MSVDLRCAAADQLEITNLALTILHDCRRSFLTTHACSLSSSTTSTLSAPEPFCVLRALWKREVLREKFKWKIKSYFFLFTRDIIFPTFLSTYAIFNVAWKQALRLSASVKTFLRLQENLRHWAAQACERSQHKGSNAGKPLPHSFQVFPRAEKCVSCSAINEDLLPSCVKRLSNIKTKPGFLSFWVMEKVCW